MLVCMCVLEDGYIAMATAPLAHHVHTHLRSENLTCATGSELKNLQPYHT